MEDRDILGNWEDHLLNTYLDSLDEAEHLPEDDEPDPDTMLGGHDNPLDSDENLADEYARQEAEYGNGEDSFEDALWRATEPSYGPMGIYHPDSDYFG